MKKIFTIVFLLISLSFYANSQDNRNSRSEISLQYDFGFSNRPFKIPKADFFERINHTNATSYYDRGMRLNYNYSFLQNENNKLLIGTGIGFSNSQHYQFLPDYKYGYLLETVIFDSKMISIPVQIGFEREIIDEKLFLNLSYGLNFSLPTKSTATYSNFVEKKYDFIDYDYTLNVYFHSKFNHLFSLTSKLKLKNNLFLNSSLSYLTNKRINYNYTIRSTYFLETNGFSSTESAGYQSLQYIELIDKYIYLSTGLSYRF